MVGIFPIPPRQMIPKQWRTIGESLVGKEPLDSKEKQKWMRFSSTLQDLVSMEPTALKARLLDIIENQKMDPTSLFTSKCRGNKIEEEVVPYLDSRNSQASYAGNDFSTFNSTVAELRKIGTERAGGHPLLDLKKHTMDLNLSIVALLPMF